MDQAEEVQISLNSLLKEVYGEKGGLPHLDGRNTIFGEVVKGIEVLDKIARKPTNEFDRPLEDVKFTITILKELK